MPISRFYAPGTSQYQSQYVPMKLPFELMQQNLARKDQEIDTAKATKGTMEGLKAIGSQSFNLPQSQREYYTGTEAQTIQQFDNVLFDDYAESENLVSNFNNKLNEVYNDDSFILKAASGDFADILLDLNKEHNQVSGKLSQNEARSKYLKEVSDEMSKKSSDIMNAPYLLSGVKAELLQMQKQPNYVPTSVPLIGSAMDRSKELISQVNVLKDKGTASEDLNPGELYSKTFSKSGRSASDYEKFAYSILDDKNSQIRRDIESQVDAHIQSGDLDPEYRQVAIDSEVTQLVESAKKLEHFDTKTSYDAKSEYTRDQELLSDSMALDVATTEVKQGVNLTSNQLDQHYTLAQNTIKKYEEKFAERGINSTMLKELVSNPNLIVSVAIDNNLPAPYLNSLVSQYKDALSNFNMLDGAHEETRTSLASITGFTEENENNLNLLNAIRQDPNKAFEIFKQGNLGIPAATNNPFYQQMVNLRKTDPELFKEILKSQNNPEEFALATLSSDQFVQNGKFNEFDAYEHLVQIVGEEALEKYSSNLGGFADRPFIHKEDFDKIINDTPIFNSTLRTRFDNYKKEEKLYNSYKEIPREITPASIVTRPGMMINMDVNSVKYISQFYDPMKSTVKTSFDGKVITGAGAVSAINAALATGVKGMPMIQTGPEDYKVRVPVTYEQAFGAGNEGVFKQFLTSIGETEDAYELGDLSSEKILNQQYVNFLKTGTTELEIDLKVNRSKEFTAYQLNNIGEENRKSSSTNTLNPQKIQVETAIINSNAIDKINDLPITFHSAAAYDIGKTIKNKSWYIFNDDIHAESKYNPGELDTPISIPIYKNGQRSIQYGKIIGVETVKDPNTYGQVKSYKTSEDGNSLEESTNYFTASSTLPLVVKGETYKAFTLDLGGTYQVVYATDAENALQIATEYLNQQP